jgi:PGF-pre-PGF domain-containing protein
LLTGLPDGFHNITLWVNDTAGNTNQSARYWTRDTAPPSISNVTSSASGTAADVSWTTNMTSNSTVFYGTNSSSLEYNATNSTFSVNHSVALSGLTVNTLYYYNATSCNYAGNCAISGTYNFTITVTSSCNESWSCMLWSTCAGGIQHRTCTDANACNTTVYRPAENQSCVAGSGGSGGGGGLIEPETQPSAEHLWLEIIPGSETPMQINRTGLDVLEIRLLVRVTAEGVSMKVTRLEKKPSSITNDPAPAGSVYQYISIDTKNIVNEKIDRARIKFKVSRKWLSDSGADKSMIILKRYVNSWEPLVTIMLYEDDENVYYEAVTTGFSYFAITAERPAACAADARRCEGSSLQQCSPDRSEWNTIETCLEGCDSEALACISSPQPQPVNGMICAPLETRCEGFAVNICSPEGTGWSVYEFCRYGCYEGVCIEEIDWLSLATRYRLLIGPGITAVLAVVLLVAVGVLLWHHHEKERKFMETFRPGYKHPGHHEEKSRKSFSHAIKPKKALRHKKKRSK